MKRLVVNGDDFGLCAGVNRGIMRAWREGILTSTTLMVTMPGAAEAFALARGCPRLGVGVHINLTGGRPLTEGAGSLTGPDGRFLRLPALLERADPDEVAAEVRAQVQAFLAHGLRPTHLDSHHHVDEALPAAADAMNQLAARLGIPVRQYGPRFNRSFYGRQAVTPDRLIAIISQVEDGLTELMTHPGDPDEELGRLSSYTAERLDELNALIDPRVREAVRLHSVKLVNYRGEEKVMKHG